MGNCIQVTQNGGVVRKHGYEDLKHYAKVFPIPLLDALPLQDKTDPPIPAEMSADVIPKRKTVKIVVTKRHLHELLNNVKELEASGTAVLFSQSFWGHYTRPKCRWRPLLATIPE